MTVDEFVELLGVGELSAHNWFMDGTLIEGKVKSVLHMINVGLTDLYAKFPLKTNQITVIMKEAFTVYNLHSSNSMDTNPEGFIYEETVEKFNDDIGQILYVTDEIGRDVMINDMSNPFAIQIREPNQLIINNPIDGDAVFVTYRSKPTKLGLGSDEIPLPDVLIQALTSFVGYKLYSGSTDTMSTNKSAMFYSQYELVCTQQQLFGAVNEYNDMLNHSFCNGGWV